jgi:hypothetical protein
MKGFESAPSVDPDQEVHQALKALKLAVCIRQKQEQDGMNPWRAGFILF